MKKRPLTAKPLEESAQPGPIADVWPVMLRMQGWDDYALIDLGTGEKLERYGPYRIVRPEAQALGRRRVDLRQWNQADAVFTGAVDEEGAGRWRFRRPLPEAWEMGFGPVRFLCRFTTFRHVGVFPEQAAHWSWMTDKLAQRSTTARQEAPRILNLFGYTGIASLLLAAAGAQVTHVDASKKAIAWARENQRLSRLEEAPIRWILDDAAKFVAREVRRGNKYRGILLDPPKYGRGPKGEVWDLFRDLPALLSNVVRLLDREADFLVLTAYAIRASFVSLHNLMLENLQTYEIGSDGRDPLLGRIESGELVIDAADDDRALSTSLYSRWSAS